MLSPVQAQIEAKLDRILLKVQKPGRYVGGELNSTVKDWDSVQTRVAFVFPDIYDIGVSNVGLNILYDQVNQRVDALAERAYAPWLDMEALMRENGIPLYALESKRPLAGFDGIFGIIAHEMAHMWFGDLVTMAWWDNLWLNEGFASWMATKASEQFYPQWRSWLNGTSAKQFAMVLDARRTSHPVQQPIADHSEAVTAFDAITYNKGQALIRMLETYLGEQVFRDGIRKYMAAHAFSNSTTADLWQALETSGGKTITGIAASFTEQDGVPLVVAETACDGTAQRLTLRQDRFVIAPASDPPLPARDWQIPVAAGPAQGKPFDEILLKGSTEIPAGACGDAIKVNLGDVGYFRVEYGPKNRRITERIPADAGR